MFRQTLLAVLLCTSACPVFAQDAPVKDVTLFEAGLAEITREAGAEDEIILRVPLKDIDDVLKSLLVRGEGVSGARVTLAGPDPVADAFAALPFPPAAATDLATLLRSVPGLEVSVSRLGEEPSTGVVMNVGETCTDAEGCRMVVTLVDDAQVTSHVIGDGVEISILDPEIALALRTGLSALRQATAGDTRQIEVNLRGEEIDDAALSYVITAPGWRTAYRALVRPDGVNLQAWAVIENATGEDWNDIRLTLSSGSPRTISANLFSRNWQAREDFGNATTAPASTKLDRNSDAISFAESAGALPTPAAATPVAPIAAATVLSPETVDSRFTFDEPINIPAGQMMSMPFLAETIDVDDILLWRGALRDRAGNPTLQFEITNRLRVRLPAGIMTVSNEDRGYIGDAQVPVVAPGETRAIHYGEDRKIGVEESVSVEQQRVSAVLVDGVLRVDMENRRTSTYAVTVHAGDESEITVDHPVQTGWRSVLSAQSSADGALVGSERIDENAGRWLRVVVPVAATSGAPGTATVLIDDVQPVFESIALGSLDAETFLYWSGEVDTSEDRAFLAEAARIAGDLETARNDLARAEASYERLVAEQNRVRDLLSSIEGVSATYDQYVRQIRGSEDAILSALDTAEDARAMIAAHEAALAAHLDAIE